MTYCIFYQINAIRDFLLLQHKKKRQFLLIKLATTVHMIHFYYQESGHTASLTAEKPMSSLIITLHCWKSTQIHPHTFHKLRHKMFLHLKSNVNPVQDFQH